MGVHLKEELRNGKRYLSVEVALSSIMLRALGEDVVSLDRGSLGSLSCSLVRSVGGFGSGVGCSGFLERSNCARISTLGILSGTSGFLGGGCSSGSGIAGLGYSGAEGDSDPGLLELGSGDGSGLGSISVRLSFDSTTPS